MGTKRIDGVARIDLFRTSHHRIRPARGKYAQPRTEFPQAELEELANDIAENGIDTPILCRRDKTNDKVPLILIAGERRWRAVKILAARGIEIEIPVRVLNVNAERAYEIAVRENVQRQDLSNKELADAVQRMINWGKKPTEVAKALGKPKSWVTGVLHYLTLGDTVQKAVDEEDLTMTAAINMSRSIPEDEHEAVLAEAKKKANGDRSKTSRHVNERAGKITRPGKKDLGDLLQLIESYQSQMPKARRNKVIPLPIVAEVVAQTLRFGVGEINRDDFLSTLAQDVFTHTEA